MTFILLLTGFLSMAQTEEEIRERADKLFEKEEYVPATKDFLHLLSLQPLDHVLNFKYGACLLYNSSQKNQGLRYLNYAVQSETIDPRAYFFRGRALHLNFQFEEAKKEYKKYQSLSGGKVDKRYKVERAIEMCDNGKRLLTTFTDIIVAEKQEIDQEKFYKIYNDRNTIGGDILVTEQFQSKLDKKMAHVPVIHFPPNAKAIYYSSYGENPESGLDIYIRRKLPDGSWGNPELLPGLVNTNEDENYPYMHPGGKFLYFSSTGHNSMGGYDIFMSRYDENTNSFGAPENVDFAISSPDDDLFYVVDSLFQNAYFASARQSQDGKLHVYKVKVARVPIQEIIVMGDFLSEINPDNKSMSIKLTSHANGEEIGTIKSNKQGKYSFVFPQGGKYEYLIEVEGDETKYKYVIDLPFLDEFRPLKQKVVETTENGQEIVKVINMFDEKTEGAEALIAEVIRKKSELNVNIDLFDLEKLEAENKQKELIASLGFGDMSPREVSTQLDELMEELVTNAEMNERVQANLENEILTKAERIAELDKIEKELQDKAQKASDPAVKYKLLNEAEKKAYEKNVLMATVEELDKMTAEIGQNSGLSPDEIAELQEKVDQFKTLVEEGKGEEAIDHLTRNAELLSNANSGTSEDMLRTYIKRSEETKTELRKYKERESEYDATIEKLNLEITTAEGKLINTNKKKEVEELKQQIANKQDELALVEKERERTRSKIEELNKQLSVIENQIVSLQNAIETDELIAVDDDKLRAAKENVDQIDAEVAVDYRAEINQLEAEHPEIASGMENSAIAVIKKQNEKEKNAITKDPSLSELEQLYRQSEVNQTAIDQTDTRLSEIENTLVSDPGNQNLIKEQEVLQKFRDQLISQNESLDEQATVLKSSTPEVALSLDDVAREIDPSYQERIKEISDNDGLSEKERLNQILSEQNSFVQKATEELKLIDSALQSDPENAELQARKEMVEEILKSGEIDIANSKEAISELESNTVDTVVVELTPMEVDKDYALRVEQILGDNSLNELEKEERLQAEDRKLLTKIAEEIKALDKKLKRDPENEELLARKEGLTRLNEKTQDQIAERNQTIAALESNETPVVNENTKITHEEVLAQLDPEYQTKLEELEANAGSSSESRVELLELDEAMHEKLSTRKKELEKELSRDQGNQNLLDELAIVSSLIEETKAHSEVIRDLHIQEMTDEELKSLLDATDPDYSNDMETIRSGSDSKDAEIAREEELQEKLQKRVDALNSNLKRKYSITVELEKLATERLISESKLREEELRSEPLVIIESDGSREEYLNSLRSATGDPEAIDKTYTSAEELRIQDQTLSNYESLVEERINELESDPDLRAKPELEKELEWLKEELENIQQKRRKVKFSIGELETIAENPRSDENNDPELNRLKDEQLDLEEKLSDESLTSSERKGLESALNANMESQLERENEIVTEEVIRNEEQLNATKESLTVLKEKDRSESVDKAIATVELEEKKIVELNVEAENADSEAERNYLLKEISASQEKALQTVKDVRSELTINELEQENGIQISTREELETKKRRFVIRIGELNSELFENEEQMKDASRKDLPALEKEREMLLAEKSLLEERLSVVDQQLDQYSNNAPVINKGALSEIITYKEEREVASTEEYKVYEAAASEALEVEDQIVNLEEELRREQKLITELLSENGTSDENVQLHISKVKELETEIDQLKIKLIQKKYLAEQLLPENEEDAMKMQNLALRGIKPIQKVVVATALLNLPSSGLAIDTSGSSTVRSSIPIPVDLESPSGLVYRVQIGAFARPIPEELFGEFNPVSGEKIEGTNVTRYMAGYFNNSRDVVDAREQIRTLGYDDAFVVAYCDGERIPFGEARKREAEGTCIAKGTNEIMMEVAEKTAEKLGIPLTSELPEVAENSYNQAPGAVQADPIEDMQGLFFTVQIGVFNRPVGEEHLHGMTEILTIRLPNGQIRYASGLFDSVEEALPRRDKALMNGVQGAFVTAYYQGERIPLSKAKKILADQGASVLQSNQKKPEVVVEEKPVVAVVKETNPVFTSNPVSKEPEVVELRVQVVTKLTFDEYPRDILNRYNAEGSFYYDESDKKVKSVIYKNADYLPRLYNFRDDIDTVYIPAGTLADETNKIIEINFSDLLIPGELMDWLLRFNYRREYTLSKEGASIRIFGVKEEILFDTMNVLRGFGVEPVVREETELELELEENEK